MEFEEIEMGQKCFSQQASPSEAYKSKEEICTCALFFNQFSVLYFEEMLL